MQAKNNVAPRARGTRSERVSRPARAARAPTSRANGTMTPVNGASRRTLRWVRPLATPKAIRWTKVMTAQARIATGYYDRKDVKEMVLEAVLKELARH